MVESRYEIDFENTEYNIEKIQQHIKTSNSSVIFLEGSFCFKNLGDIETDFKILVEVNAKIAADRLNNREIRERTEIDSEIIKLSTIKWQEAEERYINVFKPKEHADIVVSTEDEGYKIIENSKITALHFVDIFIGSGSIGPKVFLHFMSGCLGFFLFWC